MLTIVAPEHEGRGLGEWLLDTGEARASAYLPLAEPGVAVQLVTQTWSGANEAIARLGANGYELRRVFRLMQIDFVDGVSYPAPALPEGIDIRTFVRGQDEYRTWQADDEAFADHWNHQTLPFELWSHFEIAGRESFDASLWWLATDGDEVAGVALCDPTAPGGADTGWVAHLGVRRAWRGRGIARALLATAFVEFQRRGRRGVGLGVDSESQTGANRLYERAGMHTLADVLYYGKPLRPGSEA